MRKSVISSALNKNKNKERKLEAWEKKILWRIYGEMKVGDRLERITNRERMDIYGSKIISAVIRLQRMEHVIRSLESRVTKKMSKEKTRVEDRRKGDWKQWNILHY